MRTNFDAHRHNFEAEISIFPLGTGGRSTSPFNGIRWDFSYLEDLSPEGRVGHLFMIWPEFLDTKGKRLAEDVPLEGTHRALMHILVDDLVSYHRGRLKVGTQFFCVEGTRKVASGHVTSVAAMMCDD